MNTFPELEQLLKLEGGISAAQRLNDVSVERLCKLVQAILLFETMTIADQEFRWASGVLPRSGVTYRHQMSMVSWFFEEVRRLELDSSEMALTRQIEEHLLDQVDQIYPRSSR